MFQVSISCDQNANSGYSGFLFFFEGVGVVGGSDLPEEV